MWIAIYSISWQCFCMGFWMVSSDFFWPPARFIVKCTLGPLKPSFLATFFEITLVLEPLSSIARASTKFPALSLIFTFWIGQWPGTFLVCWTLRVLACVSVQWPGTLLVPYILWLLAPCIEFTYGAACGFKLKLAGRNSTLWRVRWCLLVHLSQVVPSGFLQTFVWCFHKHFWQRLFSFIISHRWLTVDRWNFGHAASWCFASQPSGHTSSLGVSLLTARLSDFRGIRWPEVSW